jgi:hypothetical protein
MKLPAPWKCDYCLQIKGETNHWWLRETRAVKKKDGLFVLELWNENLADARGEDGKHLYEHVCSASCASKALSQHMERHQPIHALKDEPVARQEIQEYEGACK